MAETAGYACLGHVHLQMATFRLWGFRRLTDDRGYHELAHV